MGFYAERIMRGVEYIEAHLDEPIALADVARFGGLSRWHYQRLFRSITGETLKSYIRGRRLDRSLDRLRDTELRVLDIALLAGFDAQESFTRAFRRAFGMTPTDYRRLGEARRFLKKLELDETHLRHRRRNVASPPVLYRQRAMTLVGLTTHYYGADSDKNDLGTKLPPLWGAFLQRLDEVPHATPGTCYGLIVEEAPNTDRLTYWAAVEVTGDGELPEGMDKIQLPARTYAKFVHHGRPTELDHTVSYAYATWLLGSGHTRAEGPDLEVYDERFVANDPSSAIDYAIPVDVPLAEASHT